MDSIGLFDMLDINGLWDNWPLSLAFAASVLLVVFLKFEHDFYKAFRKEAQEDDEYVLDELFYKTACRMSRVASLDRDQYQLLRKLHPPGRRNESVSIEMQFPLKCAICCGPADKSDYVHRRCGHVYHKECVPEWCQLNRECAFCDGSPMLRGDQQQQQDFRCPMVAV